MAYKKYIIKLKRGPFKHHLLLLLKVKYYKSAYLYSDIIKNIFPKLSTEITEYYIKAASELYANAMTEP